MAKPGFPGSICDFRDAKYDAWFSRIEHKIDRILIQGERVMTALSDLQAAMADMGSSVSAVVAEIEVLLGKITAPGTSDADVEAAVAQIKTLTTALKDEVAKAQAASP